MESYNVQVTQTAGKISCDFEAAKGYLDDRLAQYSNVVFTEDSKKDAKNTVADLRKEKKAFNDRVKEVKDEYMKPFMVFLEQAKELSDMYDKPIQFISDQIDAFEEKRRNEKKQQILELYTECISDMQEQLPLSKIYNVKWENATVNPTQIRREMMERKEAVKQGIQAICDMHTDIEDRAVHMFLESFDLTKTILYINQHEQQKREILAAEQERIRREEEERIRREERARLEAERREQEVIARAEVEKQEAIARAEAEKQAAVEQATKEVRQDVINSLIPNAEGESSLYEYRMDLTADEKEKLEMYLDSVGIDWERI